MATSGGHGRRTAMLVLGLVISAISLWLATRGLHLEDVLQHLRGVQAAPVLLGVVLATVAFPLRILRWRVLLRDTDGGAVAAGPMWHAIAIGFMGNNLLPFRAGELLRAWTITRLAPVRMTSAVASLAVERIFDAVTVVAGLGLGLLLSGLPMDSQLGGISVGTLARRVGFVAAAVAGGAGLVLTFPDAFVRLVAALVPVPRVRERLVGVVEGAREGLSALRSPRRIAIAGVWSAVIWLVNGAAFWIIADAFGIPGGPAMGLVVQGAAVIGIAVPSSPGYVGVFEAAILLALALYAVPQDLALAYALTYHATTFLPIILLGFLSLARTSIGWKDLRPA